jgi:hypothetical protein
VQVKFLPTWVPSSSLTNLMPESIQRSRTALLLCNHAGQVVELPLSQPTWLAYKPMTFDMRAQLLMPWAHLVS